MAAEGRRFLSGSKLIAIGSLAVLLPAFVLVFLQYRSLTTLESHTEAAIRENLRQTLQTVCASFSSQVSAETDAFAKEKLGPIATVPLAAPSVSIQAQFAAMRRALPEADEVFAFEFQTRPPMADFATANTFHQVAMYQWSAHPEIRRAIESFNQETATLKMREGRLSRVAFTHQESSGCPGPGCVSHFYIFLQLPNGGFAGASLKEGYLAKEYLARLLPALVERVKASPSSTLSLAVYDQSRKEIFETAGSRVEFDARMPFGRIFPYWQIAIGLSHTTVGALARQNFERSLIATVILAVVLALSITLTLRAASKEMRLAEAKANFASNVSHELKTPLALIRLFAETLELGRVTSEKQIRRYYRIINTESQRLTHLIDNILDFSRMEAGRKEYRFTRASISDLVQSVLITYEYQVKNAGFELSSHLAQDLPDARVDPDAMSQAVLNLLDNAVKYSDENKRIAVRVDGRDGQIAIEVADQGMGIPQTEHRKIFEKFYRVSTGLVHTIKGSGLGLALVWHIVKAHGGRVEVDSTPGRGSRFTILLPVERGDSSSRAAQLKS